MNKLQAMATFVAIAERGSLTSAAHTLDKSLPSVVRILALLEEHLGVRLFNRTTRRLAITDEGRRYLESCRQILDDVAEAERAMSNRQIEPRGTVRLTAPVMFGQMHVASSINRFVRAYPKISIDLQLHDRTVDLVEEGFDVGLRIAHLSDSSLVSKSLGTIRRVVCASPTLLERVEVPQHPHELRTLPCVNFTGLSTRKTWQFFDGNEAVSVEIDGAITCNHAAAAITAVRDGVGFGTFLSYQVSPYLADGSLVTVLHNYGPPPIPVNLVFPARRLMATRARTLIDWLSGDMHRVLKQAAT